ncbi:S1C family serine protease [Pedobacter sp. SYSU D00535]|uniref:S1C family serine protease n=1 Tax=Pedobacter sp. SYSU D00535 TaxID=2810308 RepID=UPI001A96215B|nr:serine protease [Pedobacter sp. SYSU D00535]
MKMTERIEAYLRGEMTAEEKTAFEELRASDPVLDQEVVVHKPFLETLHEFGEKKRLLSEMNAIHEQLDVAAIREEVIPKSTIIRTLWTKYRMNAAVAASVAVVAVFATLLTTGYFAKTNSIASGYNALRREMSKEVDRKIQRSKNELMKDINAGSARKGPAAPSTYTGTGFALTASGYIVTNNHVIDGADSIYIQDKNGNSYKAKKVYGHPQYDIAVLQVVDLNFSPLRSLPYTFKKQSSRLGENVFTLGYPREDVVLGTGYVSSNTGYKGDTVQYQIDISVNGGNSGSPLLDNKGNVIGIISGKQDNADGASFAVKSKYLLEVLEDLPEEVRSGISSNKKSSLAGLSRADQIEKIQDYVFVVKVY